MECNSLILSVIVILLMLILISYVCTCLSAKEPKQESFSSNLTWGGVPLSINSVMDLKGTGRQEGKLPIRNSKTAINKIHSDSTIPPWSGNVNFDSVEEAWGVDGQKDKSEQFTDHFLQKKRVVGSSFEKHKPKSLTAQRYMYK
jgi:hypothetical protein